MPSVLPHRGRREGERAAAGVREGRKGDGGGGNRIRRKEKGEGEEDKGEEERGCI